MTNKCSAAIALLAGLAAWVPAQAVNLSESASLEFSNDRLNPTDWLLGYGQGGSNGLLGNNVLSGSIGAGAAGVDRDYIHLVVPVGYAWTALLVGNQTTVGGNGSFIGLAAGSVMPVAPSTISAAGLLGYRIYGLADRGGDILEAMSSPLNGSSGFARPLGAGDYTLWIQELSAQGPYNYRFNAILTPVPEPDAAALLLGGVVIVSARMARRWRREGAASCQA